MQHCLQILMGKKQKHTEQCVSCLLLYLLKRCQNQRMSKFTVISYVDTYKGSRNSTIYDLTKIFLLYWIYMISAGFYNKRKTMYVIADVGLHMFFLYIFICHFVNPF